MVCGHAWHLLFWCGHLGASMGHVAGEHWQTIADMVWPLYQEGAALRAQRHPQPGAHDRGACELNRAAASYGFTFFAKLSFVFSANEQECRVARGPDACMASCPSPYPPSAESRRALAWAFNGSPRVRKLAP